MTDPRVEAHARIILDHSTRVRPGETVAVGATTLALPLVEALHRGILDREAHPILHLAPPGLDAAFFRHAKPRHLRYLPPVSMFEAKRTQVRITILSEGNTRALAGVDPRKQALLARARKPLKDLILERTRWCLTIHPTEAFAQDAEMSLTEYEDFVYGALFTDRPDPVRAWRALERRQGRLARRLDRAREIRILGEGTDLRLSVRGRKWVNSEATHNLPSGEVFSAPVEDSVEGTVHFDVPSSRAGREVAGVRLVFRRGEVVEATAEKGQDYLRRMISMDRGARRLGEIGIGTNYGIDRPTREILFDEKIGGTVHLALGSSYKECRGRNDSALHWDLIKDLRRGGEIRADGRVLQRRGRFVGGL